MNSPVQRAALRRDRRAFTLVEVLASLVLVAIILPVAMRGITVTMELASLARQRMEATALAESTVAELLVTGAWQDEDLSGDFEPDHPGYRWSAELLEWEGTTIQQLDLTVDWTARGKQRWVTLTTLVYAESE